MTQDEMDKLRAGIQALDPENDEHWNRDGNINMKALSELVGFKAIPSTLVAHGLNVTRDLVRTLRAPDAGVQGNGQPEIKEPGDVTQAALDRLQTKDLPADVSKLPFVLGAEGDSVSFHRNRKAMLAVLEHGRAIEDILGKSARKSGDIVMMEKAIKQGLGEIERVMKNRS